MTAPTPTTTAVGGAAAAAAAPRPAGAPLSPAAEHDLLRAYADGRDASAFGRLVAAHLDLVYSAALRQVRGDRHLAEDVTQVVFHVLARKAGSIERDVVLAGWLFNTTRYAAANAVRDRRRRERREREAAEMARASASTSSTSPGGPAAAAWGDVAPHIDEGLNKLPRHERDAVLLRYFEGRSLRETGDALGISEVAAAKRVSRALERLRQFFGRRGVAVPGVALAALVTGNAVQAAPAGLAASAGIAGIATAAAAGSVGSAGAAGGAALSADQVLRAMAWAKAKVALAAAAVPILALAGVAAVVVKGPARVPPTPVGGTSPVAAAVTPATPADLAAVRLPPAAGRLLPGWPVALPGHVTGSPALADLDGDGRAELIVPSMYRGESDLAHPAPRLERLVYAFRPDGSALPGWPAVITDHAKRLRDRAQAPNSENWLNHPAIVDWDGDGRDDVVVVELAGAVGISHTPTGPRLRRLADGGDGLGSAPLADLDGDGRVDLVLGWVLTSIDPAGGDKPGPAGIPGWPASRLIKSGFAPAIGSATGDGDVQVYHPSYVAPGTVCGYDRFGRVLPGWPQRVGGQSLVGASLGDVDGDGTLEVAAADQRGLIHLWTWDGRPLPSTRAIGPYTSVFKTGVRTGGGLAVVDLDGDRAAEVVAYDESTSAIRAWRGDGRGLTAADGVVARLPQASTWGGVSVANLGDAGIVDLFAGTCWVRLTVATDQVEVIDMLPPTAAATQPTGLRPAWRTIAQPTVGDVNGDGRADVAFGLVDGRVFVFDTGKPYRAGRQPWPTAHGNARRTGASRPPPFVPAQRGAPAGAAAPLALRAVDADTGAPLAGVTYTVAAGSAELPFGSDDGRGRIHVPGARPTAVWVSKPGYATVLVDLRGGGGGRSGPEKPVSDGGERVVSLPRAASVGGFVVDPDGQPVAGARLLVSASARTPSGDRVDVRDVPCVTDERGHWTCHATPGAFDGLWLRVACDGYVPDQSRVGTTARAAAALRDRSAVWVLLRDAYGPDGTDASSAGRISHPAGAGGA